MPDIKELRGAYSDKRCFVIGNGPSLRNAPFDLLKSEFTFGMNLIGLVSDYTDWLPLFYVFTSVNFNGGDQPVQTVLKAIDGAKIAFVWDKYKDSSILNKRGNIVWIPVSHTGNYRPGIAKDDWWSDDASERVSKYGTTLFPALRIAAYLGFSPLYLIGADGYKGAHNAEEPDCNHFHPRYHIKKKASWIPLANAYAVHTHKIARANCERLGVELYDASQSQGLGVLPKVDLLKVLK